jgi:hypothetical protein
MPCRGCGLNLHRIFYIYNYRCLDQFIHIFLKYINSIYSIIKFKLNIKNKFNYNRKLVSNNLQMFNCE